jgi:hypothetical protein
MTMITNLGWRIASTEAGLQKGAFFVRRIPPPHSFEYKDYSVRRPQSQGGESRHGYENVTILWDRLTPKQSNELRTVIQAGLDDAGYIYLTVDRSNGLASGRDWIDVRGRPQMPDFLPLTPVAGSNGIMHGSVRLFVNELFIVNDPASF